MLLIEVFEVPASAGVAALHGLRRMLREQIAGIKNVGLNPEDVVVAFHTDAVMPIEPRVLVARLKMITETPMVSWQTRDDIMRVLVACLRAMIESEHFTYARIVIHYDGYSRERDAAMTVPLKITPKSK